MHFYNFNPKFFLVYFEGNKFAGNWESFLDLSLTKGFRFKEKVSFHRRNFLIASVINQKFWNFMPATFSEGNFIVSKQLSIEWLSKYAKFYTKSNYFSFSIHISAEWFYNKWTFSLWKPCYEKLSLFCMNYNVQFPISNVSKNKQ